jgi:ribosome modulation factor
MTKREDQAYNDGRNAYRAGVEFDVCPRRAADQRRQWRAGFEHERKLDTADKLTDEEITQSAEAIEHLRSLIMHL